MDNNRRDEILLEIYGDMKTIHEKVENMEKDLNKISKAIYGNGVPGLITRTQNNEYDIKDLNNHIKNCQTNKKYKTQIIFTIISLIVAGLSVAVAYYK